MNSLTFKFNHNYKKVDVNGDNKMAYVAVLVGDSFEHFSYRGVKVLSDALEGDGHLSVFFARGGFKREGDYGFTYPDDDRSLIAYVEDGECWTVMPEEGDTPITGVRYDTSIATRGYWL